MSTNVTRYILGRSCQQVFGRSMRYTYRTNTSHIVAGDQACVAASTCLTPSFLSSELVSGSSSTAFPFSTTLSERVLSSWISIVTGTDDGVLRIAMLNEGLLADSQRFGAKMQRCGQPQDLQRQTSRPSYITASIPRHTIGRHSCWPGFECCA